MTSLLRQRLGELVGAEHLMPETGGAPHIAPPTIDAVAAVMAFAADEGLLVAAAGAGTWQEPDPRAALVVDTRALVACGDPRPEDFVVTAECGLALDALRARLLPHRLVLPLDPPFGGARTLGSVLATATAGPLQLGFGPVRDQVLGLTVVTGDGRIVRTGGATVKNVAGFDLLKLQVGGFGAFGILAECTLRLRAAPAADRTFLLHGGCDPLTATARALVGASVEMIAAELIVPDHADPSRATLAIRCAGSGPGVEATAAVLRETAGGPWQERAGDAWWQAASETLRGDPPAPVTLRLGCLPDGLDDTLDLLREHLPGGALSAGVATGLVRWTGSCAAHQITAVRTAMAAREIPVTLERAPWGVRRQAGHFGAYREGVAKIVAGLRDVFDPERRLATSLEAEAMA